MNFKWGVTCYVATVILENRRFLQKFAGLENWGVAGTTNLLHNLLQEGLCC